MFLILPSKMLFEIKLLLGKKTLPLTLTTPDINIVKIKEASKKSIRVQIAREIRKRESTCNI